jgi:hypothetical protein
MRSLCMLQMHFFNGRIFFAFAIKFSTFNKGFRSRQFCGFLFRTAWSLKPLQATLRDDNTTTMKTILTLILFTLSTLTFAQTDTNQNKISSFLKELSNGNSSSANLYSKYIFINEPGKPDRSEDAIKYYTDTLFNEIGNSIRKASFHVYPLAKARVKFKKENLCNYYYDGQKNTIYVVAIKTEKGFEFYYTLMYLGKIVSLMPNRIIDNQIIGWE